MEARINARAIVILCLSALLILLSSASVSANPATPIAPTGVSPADTTGGTQAGTPPTGGPPGQAGKVTKVPPVVITASKIEEPLSDVPASMTVITGEDIERHNAVTVQEVLREVPGLDLQRSGGAPGTFTQVRLRGANDNQVAILVDGARVNDLFRGGGFDFGLLPADNVDRIEVVRGGLSALYGSDAIGGVVNIITRRGEGEPHLVVFSEGGSQETMKHGARLSGEVSGTDFSLSYARLDSAGLRPGPFDHNYDRENHFSALIGRDFGPEDNPRARLQATFNASTQDFQSPYDFPSNFNYSAIPPGLPQSIQTFEPNNGEDRFFLTTTETLMVKPTDWWETNLRFSYTRNRTWARNDFDLGVPFPSLFGPQFVAFGPFFFPIFPVTNFFRTRTEDSTVEAEILNHFTLEGDHWKNVLTAGYHFERNHVAFRDFSTTGSFGFLPPMHSTVDATRNRHAHFYQDELTLWDRLFLTAGVRIDQESQEAHILGPGALMKTHARKDSLYGIQVNPRYAAAFKITEIDGVEIKLHGAYSRNFHAPTFSALFFPGYSNPDLQPEIGKSMEGGVGFEALEGKLGGDVTYFRTDFTDLIVFVLRPPPVYFSYENEGKAKAEGLEVSAHAGPWKGFRVGGSYTFLDTRGDDGKDLQRRPRHKFNGTVSYERDRITVNVDVNVVGGQRDSFDFVGADGRVRAGDLPRYHTVDLSATYDLLRDRGPLEKLQIYGRVFNAFDTGYEEVKGFPAAGTTAFGGVRAFLF
jgi:vitamin B12 transporter